MIGSVLQLMSQAPDSVMMPLIMPPQDGANSTMRHDHAHSSVPSSGSDV